MWCLFVTGWDGIEMYAAYFVVNAKAPSQSSGGGSFWKARMRAS